MDLTTGEVGTVATWPWCALHAEVCMRRVWVWGGVLVTVTTGACYHPPTKTGVTPASNEARVAESTNAGINQCVTNLCAPLYVVDGVIIGSTLDSQASTTRSDAAAVPLYVIDGVIVSDPSKP
jgi:hypothetical protein